jgi:hypothetical protein
MNLMHWKWKVVTSSFILLAILASYIPHNYTMGAIAMNAFANLWWIWTGDD